MRLLGISRKVACIVTASGLTTPCTSHSRDHEPQQTHEQEGKHLSFGLCRLVASPHATVVE
jgi:hypothetical protein